MWGQWFKINANSELTIGINAVNLMLTNQQYLFIYLSMSLLIWGIREVFLFK